MSDKNRAIRDRYGFFFWLKWILWFTGSLVLSATFWTWLLQGVLGTIQGAELIFTWSVSVFGSWLILVIPFMRKKEQIWKRLNDDQEKAAGAWLGGMSAFIGLLVASAFGWSFYFKNRIASESGFDRDWTKAVFGTWLFLLIPFLVLLYRQADQIFKNAVIRQGYGGTFQTAAIARSCRLLPRTISEKVKSFEPTMPGGHVVTVVLKDNRRIGHVFILQATEILGLYDKTALDFEMSEILDVEPTRLHELPPYQEEKWLRLDGTTTHKGSIL
jgi:hypothetical protein